MLSATNLASISLITPAIIMKKIFYALFTCLTIAPSCVQAQHQLAPNVRKYLLNNPPQGRAATQQPPQMLSAYICTTGDNEQETLDALKAKGIRIGLHLEHLLTAQIPENRIGELAQLPGIRYVQLASATTAMMDKARVETSVDQLHDGSELGMPYSGKDVVIGIVDAGFDYTHPNFRTADGKELRIRRVWEQDNTAGTPPEGFAYGAEYTTPEAITRASYDIENNSHGTHVAGIAAGACHDNPWYGVAGDAELVLVSKGQQTLDNVNISDAVAYIYRYAQSVGKPCVVNLSLGMQTGPHDGTSLFDQVTDRLQGPGCLLVGSAGNFHGYPLHIGKNFEGADSAPLRTMIDFREKPSARNVGGEIDIWGEPGMKYDVQVVMHYYSKGENVCESAVIDASRQEGNSHIFEISKNGTGKVIITTEINPFNHKPHTLISLEVSSIRNRNALGIIITPKSAGEVHLWADHSHVSLTDNGCEGWTKGDGERTLAEIGGTGKNIISVGAYTTRNVYQPAGSSREEQTGEKLHDIASFSSTGPALDGRMKPDVTAPGTYIISSLNSHDNSSMIPVAGTIEGTAYRYGYMQGTSMAAPFVTGVVATWLQAYPTLSPDGLRQLLKSSARQDDFTQHAASAPNGTWGYGKIDAYAGIKQLLAATGIELQPAEQAVSLHRYSNGFSLLFAHANEEVSVALFNAAGKCCQKKDIGKIEAGLEYSMNTDGLPHGVYLIQVRGKRNMSCFKIVR